jgi:hypothetical protein
MDEPKHDIYKLTDEREIKLWQDAIFIFDSSALLNLYFLPLKTRNKVFELFSTKLKDRLWLPSHVKYEYYKNREKVIRKPISENYQPLKDNNLKAVKNSIKEIETKLADLKNKTEKDDKHPHIPQEEIDAFIIKTKEFKIESANFEDSLIKRIIKAEEEINQLPSNDDVSKAVGDLFKVGRYYEFKEIIEITKEGKHRYEHLIPPGYEDLQDKEKKGTQIFGDLIIWKQIIEFATEVKKPIILICNDLKEDWCHLDKSTTEKRIESPREELIKEIYDSAEVDFWMYNLPPFLYKSNEYFNAEIENQNIDNLTQFNTTKVKPQNALVFDCNKCGKRHCYKKEELEMDFECVSSDERNMGPENEYQATEFLVCDECGKEINVTFSVWEYPVGIHNYDETEIDGGKLVSCFLFSVNFSDDQEPNICKKCGDHFFDERHIGICNKCDEAYRDN